jgi:hypothetical protein
MPDITESDSGAVKGGMKQRLPKAASFNSAAGASGYSTDESHAAANNKKRRAGRKHHHDNGTDKASDGGKASVIWMVLVIGLTFCLMDAVYIARVLDRGPTAEAEQLSTEQILARLQDQSRPKAEKFPVREISEKGYFPFNMNFKPQARKARTVDQDNMRLQLLQHNLINARRRHLTPEEMAELRAQQAELKILAEANRIRMIKMAAIEAIKAEHGGEIPAELMDQVMEDEESFKPRPMDYYKEQAIKDDKTRILELFIDAGLTDMDDSTYRVLPKWGDVKNMYGDEAKIIGLEQCESFRQKGNLWDHFVSTAGTFNSGTNLMAEMLIHNCHMEERMKKFGAPNRGIRWQVPWGKVRCIVPCTTTALSPSLPNPSFYESILHLGMTSIDWNTSPSKTNSSMPT